VKGENRDADGNQSDDDSEPRWRWQDARLLDQQHHAFGIDIRHLQRNDLGNAQPRTVGDTQRRFVLDARRCLQKARNLFGGLKQPQLTRLVHERRVLGEVGSIERHFEKEPQCRYGGIDLWRTCATRRQMQSKAAHVLRLGRVGRAAKERGEILDSCT
jgi:hypothetical protein